VEGLGEGGYQFSLTQILAYCAMAYGEELLAVKSSLGFRTLKSDFPVY
jgi:hypothetical protein